MTSVDTREPSQADLNTQSVPEAYLDDHDSVPTAHVDSIIAETIAMNIREETATVKTEHVQGLRGPVKTAAKTGPNIRGVPCIALYDYTPRHLHDVSLVEGTTVHLLDKHDEEGNMEWWNVSTEDNVVGYVPASYLFPLPADENMRPCVSSTLSISEELRCLHCQQLLFHPVVHSVCGAFTCTHCLWMRGGGCPRCGQVVRWAKVCVCLCVCL